MERRDVHTLLDEVAKGTLSVDEAAARLANQPFVDLGYAKPDLHRGLRQGTSEVIYGAAPSYEDPARYS
ncbi:MAG TPA: 1-(5-phosphoribosyl)-5-amino-4-imidazole-carboxylate carboxylase, partial [Atopobiaceae bacterium]|nr:1-(5-phosphoribosyl)-5-amino-4-imidazole-carboxylate carboxylase [Atopobiaceae bacterium]